MSQTITIIGLGSLMSEESARTTCPNLSNYRLTEINGYKRIFNKTDSYLARTNALPKDSNAYACLSAIPCTQTPAMIVSVFDIPLSEWPHFVQREFEYRLVRVPHNADDRKGVLCVGDYKNDEECMTVIHADPLRLERWQEFRAHYDGPMWRRDLLPYPEYLERCLNYTQKHGQAVYENFIQTTFIGDGRSIAEYIGNK